SIKGTDVITVNRPPATHFDIQGSASSSTAGAVFSFTVTAEDVFNDVAVDFAGTVTFSSSDTGPSTVLPGDSTLVSGLGTFSATLTTAGNQTVTATDIAPAQGNLAITFTPAAAQ